MKNLIDVSVKFFNSLRTKKLPNKIKVSMICMIAILLNGVSGTAFAGNMLTDPSMPLINGVGAIMQVDQGYQDFLPTTSVIANLFLFKRFDTHFAPVAVMSRVQPITNIPVIFGRMSSTYGPRRHPISGKLKQHRGIDIPLPSGTPINPAAEGVVIFSGWQNGFGNVIKIDHGNGYVSLYAHNSSNHVKVGDTVTRETVIGAVGATGWATGPHIHLEILLNGKNVNPEQFVRRN